jgi:6-phosphogluconolactonase (cycloisomerase 2 family)
MRIRSSPTSMAITCSASISAPTRSTCGTSIPLASSSRTPCRWRQLRLVPDHGTWPSTLTGQHAYVLSELASSVTVFDYDPVRAAFIWQQTISTLPPDFSGTNTTAEIRIHPNGRFLYNAHRGHNSVTIFEIEPETGELEVIGWESTRGEWPRGMNLDPSGSFLYAANQNTDNIAVFRIDRASGKLQFSSLVTTPTPVDVEFGPVAF